MPLGPKNRAGKQVGVSERGPVDAGCAQGAAAKVAPEKSLRQLHDEYIDLLIRYIDLHEQLRALAERIRRLA